jgi:hypothetical protein
MGKMGCGRERAGKWQAAALILNVRVIVDKHPLIVDNYPLVCITPDTREYLWQRYFYPQGVDNSVDMCGQALHKE